MHVYRPASNNSNVNSNKYMYKVDDGSIKLDQF